MKFKRCMECINESKPVILRLPHYFEGAMRVKLSKVSYCAADNGKPYTQAEVKDGAGNIMYCNLDAISEDDSDE